MHDNHCQLLTGTLLQAACTGWRARRRARLALWPRAQSRAWRSCCAMHRRAWLPKVCTRPLISYMARLCKASKYALYWLVRSEAGAAGVAGAGAVLRLAQMLQDVSADMAAEVDCHREHECGGCVRVGRFWSCT